MVKFFPEQKKPDSKKNFFQNYDDHALYLMNEQIKLCEDYWKSDKKVEMLAGEASKRIYVFDALRDGYDYMDEVAGVTVLPLVYGAACIGLTALAIWEGCKGLAMKVGLMDDDGESHGNNAGAYLLGAGAAFLFAVGGFIKSLFSLVTRPLVTFANGYKPQDTTRFYDSKVAEQNAELINGVTQAFGLS